MRPIYNSQAPKRPANLSVNGDLLSKAKDLGINLSATLEQALADAVVNETRGKWLDENKSAIEAYNQLVEVQGVFSDGNRSF